MFPRRRHLAVILLLSLLAAASCGGSQAVEGPHPTPAADGESRGDVLVVIADRDFNGVEFLAVRDSLVRAGYTPVVASAGGGPSGGSDDVVVTADTTLGEVTATDYRGIAVIGGSGATQYFDDAGLHTLLRETLAAGRPVGAICLAPVILARAGLLKSREATVWVDERDELEKGGCSKVGEGVVVDGMIVTGDGPDSAEEFGDAFVARLDAAAGNSPGS